VVLRKTRSRVGQGAVFGMTKRHVGCVAEQQWRIGIAITLAAIAWMGSLAPARAAQKAAPTLAVEAIDTEGTFKSRNERCGASFTTADIGEYHVLSITRDGRTVQSINGATGFAWLKNNKLVYTSTAIYGEGGVFVFDCQSAKRTALASKLEGDAFKLIGVTDDTPPVVYFFFSTDISAPHGDWHRMRVKLDGAGLSEDN